MKNIQMNGVNLNTNVSNAKKTQKAKPQAEARPQLKEHCSSKAGQALRNAALGVMLAASVVAGTKAATISAKAVEQKEILPQTSYSQEVEAVSDTENLTNKKPVTIACTASRICEGDMTSGFRDYKYVEINDDGTINFYSKDRVYDSKDILNLNDVLSFNDEYHYTKEIKNQFDLKGNIFKNKDDALKTNMTILSGTKFNEISNKYGDYVVMDENCVLSVYDKDDNKVGSVQFKNYNKEINKTYEESGDLASLIIPSGILTGLTAPFLVAFLKKDKNEES